MNISTPATLQNLNRTTPEIPAIDWADLPIDYPYKSTRPADRMDPDCSTLIEYEGRRLVMYADVWVPPDFNPAKWVTDRAVMMLKNIRFDHDGDVLMPHMWVDAHVDMPDMENGDILKFDALIRGYWKANDRFRALGLQCPDDQKIRSTKIYCMQRIQKIGKI
jgi:hypothetical protein